MANFRSDHPTLDDLLDRPDMLHTVAYTVKSCSAPTVIGVYGDWGSGKTSFLRSLQLILSGVKPPIVCSIGMAESQILASSAIVA